MKLFAAAVTLALLMLPLYGHHSFSAYYFEDQSTKVEGEVAEFEYRSPHAWVHVMARDEQGITRRYSAEWNNVTRLAQQGIHKDTFKPGDRVIITGSPGRKPSEFKIHLKSIERPADGLKWPAPRTRR